MDVIKKAFIGYDLGDGETITDFVVIDMRSPGIYEFKDMEMPDSNSPGQAIPTAYAYSGDGKIIFASSILEELDGITDIHNNFKRCPSDLMGKISEERKISLLSKFESGFASESECPEAYSDEMNTFRKSVITFTNAIFEDKKYKEKIRSEIDECDDLVFCVGHPTKWSDLDVAIYKAILSESILGNGEYLGKSTEIVMEKESRAAYLYVRDKTKESVLPAGTLALLIDVGSSTIDLTALTSDSRNYQYNSGSKNLGARSVDFLIRDWYLENLKTDEYEWIEYQKLVNENPTLNNALSLSCRKAKEEVYSKSAGKSRIIFGDFAPERINAEIINELVSTRPIAGVLKKWADLSDEDASLMGDKSWTQMFESFLIDRKKEMDSDNIKIGRIILTGSASKMPFIMDIIRKIFTDVDSANILSDINPSRSISQGLALVGPSNEKSKEFQKDVEDLLNNKLPQCVNDAIPSLADKLSTIIENIIINNIIKPKVNDWKNERYTTLNQMTKAIENACSKENLNAMLSTNQEYNATIKNWSIDDVGQKIAIELKEICKKYNVSEFSVDDLNIMQNSSVKISGMGDVSGMDSIMNAVVAIVSVIAGIITAVILPTILAILIDIIGFISIDIAILVCDLLLMLPGLGWVILTGLVGIAAAKAVKNGMGGAKEKIADIIKDADLPSIARGLMKDDKLNQKLREANLKRQIKDSILKPESKNKIVNSVSEGLRNQIQKRSDEIKYVIESK